MAVLNSTSVSTPLGSAATNFTVRPSASAAARSPALPMLRVACTAERPGGRRSRPRRTSSATNRRMSSSDKTPPPAPVVGARLIHGGAPKAVALAILPALAVALVFLVLLGPMVIDVIGDRLCVLWGGEGGGERRGREGACGG